MSILENLIFCLNATVPIFLLMCLGYFFRKVGIFNEALTKGMNNFVFKIALPVLVYTELAGQNFMEVWDGGFVLFCFLTTAASIFISYLLAKFFKEPSSKAEFIQGSYRSSAALLGVGIATNLYGHAGMTPLMIIGAVPLYNVMAVFVLNLYGEGKRDMDKALLRETLIDVIKNPIIIGIALGIIRSFIPVGILLPKTVSYVSGLATPLGLMALGASFNFGSALKKAGPAVLATFMKLIGFCLMWIPLAMAMGYTHDKMVAILIMAGSPTTVSTFVMAKSMGHDGVVSSSIVMLTTILSAFTLTLWLFILRTMGVI